MSIADLISDKIEEALRKGLARFKKLEKTKQRHIVLGGITLALGLGLFFSAFLDSRALAQNKVRSNAVDDAVMDPLNKIDKGLIKGVCVGECQFQREMMELSRKEEKLDSLVSRHPISAMVPYIVKRDQKVASFLVAIAKKESDWGKHTPKKGGRECFNFWGYRGKENTTDSGYSCFDSPEHAVQVVGDRIEKLVNKKIDTPAKMVVWKCGSNCEAAGGQAAADKWIADVAHVYKKLQS